jgi:type I restriction enzyme S subunit
MIETIIKSFDVWTDAQGVKSKGRVKSIANINLEGLARLREFILELAIRGKLSTQSPNDSPAIDLLKKIKEDKKRLFENGVIKKQSVLEEVIEEKKTFKIPSNWAWCKLQDLVSILGDGIHGTPNYDNNGCCYFINGNNLNGGTIEIKPETKTVSDEEFIKHKRPLNERTILVSINGTIGNTAFYNNEKVILGKSACYFNLMNEIDKNFIKLLLNTSYFLEYALLEATGTTIKNIGLKTMRSFVLPLPPHEEQKRIVAKVDELMSLCDELENQQIRSLSTHQTLVKTLLETLTHATGADELQLAWEKISLHFDTLFCTEDSIDQLKQVILQLAVMGRLVKQDANDEPAEKFLEQIATIKDTLLKEGKIRKQIPFLEISGDEKPCELPLGWTFSRLGIFTIIGTGATPSRDRADYFNPAEINWVTSGETNEDFIFETKEKVSSLALKETNISIYPKGSLIVAMYGQGKTRGQVSELMVEAGTNQACAVITLVNKDDSHRKYLKLFFKKAYEEIRSNAAGGAQPNLNLAKIANTVIPLPPIAEQNRIVIKVAELFCVCDLLKEKISATQEIKISISKTIIENSVA